MSSAPAASTGPQPPETGKKDALHPRAGRESC